MTASRPPYRTYADLLADLYGEAKVQKISIDIGNSCPNRDGTLSRGGCTYCNVASFTPAYCSGALSVAEQMRRGREFFARKYPHMRYLAYFQSYTNTNTADISRLSAQIDEALAQPDTVGAVIATRPDCLPEATVAMLAEKNSAPGRVVVELGAESSHDTTLRLVNRCHTWAQSVDAVNRLADNGLTVGLHLIMGLPGESREMMLETVDRVGRLPIASLKMHQLQVLRGTVMSRQYERGEISLTFPTPEEYLNLCVEIVKRLPRHIAIDRFVSQAPAEMLIAPRWGMKNYLFVNMLCNRLRGEENRK